MYTKEVNEFINSTPVKDCNPEPTSQENYDLSSWNDIPAKGLDTAPGKEEK